jgi:hypothetical protein
MSNNYRRCAGAIVFNKEGRVFLGKRIGVETFSSPRMVNTS